ncbi:hypothetical protein FOE67_23745, partial [Streptomyces calidiresistens]
MPSDRLGGDTGHTGPAPQALYGFTHHKTLGRALVHALTLLGTLIPVSYKHLTLPTKLQVQ